MDVGVCKITLRLPENHSLKDKRRVVKSIITRVRNNYNVSAAEVEEQEQWKLTTLGITCIGNSARHLNEMLSKVVNFIGKSRLDAEMLDYQIEILPVF
jgi:hypothetical protein